MKKLNLETFECVESLWTVEWNKFHKFHLGGFASKKGWVDLRQKRVPVPDLSVSTRN